MFTKFKPTQLLFATLVIVFGFSTQPSTAYAAPLKVDAAKSQVTIQFKEMGVSVNSRFQRFTALVDYDEKQVQNSKASVEIDMTSLELGAPDYNKEVTKKEWFNSATFPKASFISSSMKSVGPDRLEVVGKLTIKGKTIDVTMPVQVKKEATGWRFDGKLPIRRLTFNIGEGEWKDTSMVADEVVISFSVLGNR